MPPLKGVVAVGVGVDVAGVKNLFLSALLISCFLFKKSHIMKFLRQTSLKKTLDPFLNGKLQISGFKSEAMRGPNRVSLPDKVSGY